MKYLLQLWNYVLYLFTATPIEKQIKKALKKRPAIDRTMTHNPIWGLIDKRSVSPGVKGSSFTQNLVDMTVQNHKKVLRDAVEHLLDNSLADLGTQLNKQLTDQLCQMPVLLDGTQMNIEDALTTASTKTAQQSNVPLNTILVPYLQFVKIAKSAMVKKYVIMEANDTISFSGFQITLPTGTVNVVPVREMPKDKLICLNLHQWEYQHLSDAVMLWDLDGHSSIRNPVSDGHSFRFFSMGQLVSTVETPAGGVVLLAA